MTGPKMEQIPPPDKDRGIGLKALEQVSKHILLDGSFEVWALKPMTQIISLFDNRNRNVSGSSCIVWQPILKNNINNQRESRRLKKVGFLQADVRQSCLWKIYDMTIICQHFLKSLFAICIPPWIHIGLFSLHFEGRNCWLGLEKVSTFLWGHVFFFSFFFCRIPRPVVWLNQPGSESKMSYVFAAAVIVITNVENEVTGMGSSGWT